MLSPTVMQQMRARYYGKLSSMAVEQMDAGDEGRARREVRALFRSVDLDESKLLTSSRFRHEVGEVSFVCYRSNRNGVASVTVVAAHKAKGARRDQP